MAEAASRKSAVRLTYDTHAADYASRHRMQTGNLRNLAQRLLDSRRLPERILDVGAGAGSTILDIVADDTWTGDTVLPTSSTVVVTDLSSDALRERQPTQSLDLPAVQCDAEWLPFADASFELVYANSVLHWVRLASGRFGFQHAVNEIVRVTQPRGRVGVSISGVGTAARFLRAYRHVLHELQRTGLVESLRPHDPIGSMELVDVVTAFEVAGATIVEAELVYEPVIYPQSADYVADALAYGYDVFLAPVAPEHHIAAWYAITEAFVAEVGENTYVHDQYMIYVVAEPVPRHAVLQEGVVG